MYRVCNVWKGDRAGVAGVAGVLYPDRKSAEAAAEGPRRAGIAVVVRATSYGDLAREAAEARARVAP
jgi:hypothetical protein